jgi:hypothetical protein
MTIGVALTVTGASGLPRNEIQPGKAGELD